MQLKDLGNLTSAINTFIKTESLAGNVNDVLSVSFKEMSAAQILAKTSTLGLTDAQKLEIVQQYATDAANYQNIASISALSTAQKSSTISIDLNTMSMIGNTAATQAQVSGETKNLLVKGKLITEEQIQAGTTVALTKAKIADAVATGNLTKAEGKQLVSTLGLTGATGGLGAAFKGLGVQLKMLATANPFLTLIGVAAALTVVVIGVTNWFEKAGERAKETSEKAREELEKTRSEINQINSSLDTAKQRINELNAKQNLSLIEAEELEKLKNTNDELERELRIKEALEKQEKKDANDSAVNYFNAKTNKAEYAGAGYDSLGDYSGYGGMYLPDPTNYTVLEYVEKNIAKIPKLRQELSKLENQLRRIEDTDDFKNNPDWLYIKGSVNRVKTELGGYEDEINTYIKDFMEEDDSLVEGIDDGILSRLEQIYQKYDEIFNGVAQSHTTQIQAILDKSNFRDYEQQLLNIAANGSLSIETITSKFPDLISYLEKAGISAQELYQYIMNLSNPDAVKYDELKNQLNDVLGLNNAGDSRAMQIGNLIQDANLYSDEALTAFVTIKARYVNGETETWTAEDWAYNIQEELNKSNDETELNYPFAFDKLGDIPNKLSEIENAYKTAQSALEEYNEKGCYSMSTIDSLLALEDEYINMLVDENGQLNLNSNSMIELARIKIEAAKASVYQETCTELVRLKELDTALAAQELALANGALTESAYKTAKALYEEVVAMGGANAALANNVWNAALKKIALLDGQLNSLSSGKYRVNVATETDTKKAETDWKDFLEKELAIAKAEFECGLTDFQESMTKRKNILDDYLLQGKVSYADYWNYIKEGYEEQKKIYDRVLSAVTARFDKEIDSYNKLIEGVEKQNDALQAQKETMENAAQAVADYYQSLSEEQQHIIDGLEDKNNALNSQLSDYDKILSAIDRVYDTEQNALAQQKDALQEKIDLLNDNNSELDLQYRKEQALYELHKSQNQRTKKVLTQDGFTYQTDADAVRENQKNLNDLQNEELITKLEEEQAALQDSIDSLQEYRDSWNEVADVWNASQEDRLLTEMFGENASSHILQNHPEDLDGFRNQYQSASQQINDNTALIASIQEKLEQYAAEEEAWSALTGVIQDNVNRQAALQLFGADWQKQINEGRFLAYDEFKTGYLGIEAQLNDNTALIESYNEKITYYENLKTQWGDIADEYEDSVDRQYAAMILGQNWEGEILSGRLETLSTFKNDYISIQQAIADAAWASANEQIEAAKEAAKAENGSTGSTGSVGDSNGIINNLIGNGSWNNTDALRQEQLASRKKTKTYHTGLKEGPVGSRFKTEDFSILEKFALKQDEVPAILKKREAVLTEEQMGNLARFLQTAPIMPDIRIPDKSCFTNLTDRDNTQPLSLSIGEIHLHNVQNTDSFADAIIREFPNKMLQAMHRRH